MSATSFTPWTRICGFDIFYPLIATIEWTWTRQRFNMILFTLFSLIALVLAAIGIYGVMAYSVNQRTHEIGIRMALGAMPRDVLRLILGSGARIVCIGLLLGTAGALASTRALSFRSLFNVSPAYDPVSYIGIIVILLRHRHSSLAGCRRGAPRRGEPDRGASRRVEHFIAETRRSGDTEFDPDQEDISPTPLAPRLRDKLQVALPRCSSRSASAHRGMQETPSPSTAPGPHPQGFSRRPRPARASSRQSSRGSAAP